MGDFDFSDIDFQKIDADLAQEDMEKTMELLKKLGPGAMELFLLGRAIGRIDILNQLAVIVNTEVRGLEMFTKGRK